jgi:hypothetical protein
MEEIWKFIPEYEGYYQVSNLGNFKSVDRIIKYKQNGTRLYHGKYLLTETTKDNYQRITLMKDSIKKRYMAHRLVAITFIVNTENKPFINHIDGNKSNNIVSNLEWCTESENIRHADRTGLRNMLKNSNPSNSKKIQCIETGKIFNSCNKALCWLGNDNKYISTLTRSIKRGGKAYGYHWKFIN